MACDPSGPSYARDLGILFQSGVIGSLSDRELLERFATDSGSGAQRAFEAIVQRHGSMVLGVCRRVLRDSQLAEDAFQATFLVLALKAGSIRRPDSLGPWLHGVAVRIARRARDARSPDVTGVELSCHPVISDTSVVRDSSFDTLDEEIERLPAAYRRAIILCYLEGRTQEEAARLLGWTKGTVSGRLARAKELLRVRLTRRGLAPSLVAASLAAIEETASASVPLSLVGSTTKIALNLALGRGELAVATASVVRLAQMGLRALTLAKLKTAILSLLVVSALGAGVFQSVAQSVQNKGSIDTGDGPAPKRAAPVRQTTLQAQPYDVPLPKQARLRLGTTRLRHEENVTSVSFSPDGRTLASGSWDGIVRFWDVSSGKPILEHSNQKQFEAALTVAYSPDGSKIAIGWGDRLVQVWDLKTQRVLWQSNAQKGRISSVAFSPDGKTLATVSDEDTAVSLWNVDDGRQTRKLRTSAKIGFEGVLAFSPDGSYLALGTTSGTDSGQPISIWQLDATDKPPQIIPKAHDVSLTSLCFTPDSKSLISCGTRTEKIQQQPRTYVPLPQIRIWDATTGQHRRDFELGQISGMNAIALSRDGKRLVSSHRDRLLVWEMPEAKLRQIIPTAVDDYAPRPGGLAFSPDGRLVASERGNAAVHLWDLATRRELFTQDSQNQTRVSATAFSADGRTVFTGGMDGVIQRWDAIAGAPAGTLEMGMRGKIYEIRCTHDNGLVIACSEYVKSSEPGFGGRVRVWNLADGKVLQTVDFNQRAVVLALSSDSHLAAVGEWDIDLGIFGDRNKPLPSTDHLVEVFETTTGRIVQKIRGDDVQLLSLSFSKNNKSLMSVGNDSVYRVWDIATGQEQRRLVSAKASPVAPTKAQGIRSLVSASLSPDLSSAITSRAGDDGLLMWDLNSGNTRQIVKPARNQGAYVSWAPNGRFFASVSIMRNTPGGDDTNIHLWDALDGREVLQLDTGGRHVSSLAFSPDGQSLVTGMDDTTALIWNVAAAYKAVDAAKNK